ncbi:MAG: murein biosynthesis integral membrane protein MurJ [Candidatus Wildermuthbacteria bacterium]|nr:murein biosynthesis integral membrane protein MurJ [Candidatus Wildermuthbacteria bacterium]
MMIANILNFKTKTVAFGGILLALSSAVSSALGIVRDRLLAGRFGAGPELDAYFAAFRIPDLLYGILIIGGFTAVFVPLFSEYAEKSKEEAWRFTSNLLHVFLLFFSALSLLLLFGAPLLVRLVAPGFTASQYETTVFLTRLMLLSPLVLGVSAIVSGVLQYAGRFFLYALAPILYNAGIIAGILFFVPAFGIIGLGMGVLFGAMLHLLVQVPGFFAYGFRWQAILRITDPAMKKIFVMVLPRLISTSAYQISATVLTALASTFSAGSIAVFQFANNIQYFPVGIFGVSFALASFPNLSRAFVHHDHSQFLRTFSSTFRQTVFFTLPVALWIFLMRSQIVRLLLGTGKFGEDDIRLTAASLAIFSFVIVFHSLVPLLARAFFALQDTKTPTVVHVGTLLFNISAAFFLAFLFNSFEGVRAFFSELLSLQDIEDIRVLALPLSLAMTGFLQFLFLFIFLRKEMSHHWRTGVLVSFLKLLIAAFVSGVALSGVLAWHGAPDGLQDLFAQAALAGGAGLLSYLFVCVLVRSSELREIFSSLKK